ncbi:uricase [Martensiomyces pterosporus]|nr:uricase [Martensiomyces pterosporus]
METSIIKSQAYGKDRVRVVRVVRHSDGWQEIADYSVCCLLSGEQFTSSYTKGDNRLVVATDSQKNTVYYLAKTLPAEKVMTPEIFASEVASFMANKYAHVTSCRVKITTKPWERMQFDGAAHPHSFCREGKETRWTEALVTKLNPPSSLGLSVQITSGFYDLEVLKTTNSSFVGFWRDELTTLPDMADRMLSTKVLCQWRYVANTLDALKDTPFNAVYAGAKRTTLDTFANDQRAWVNASVQTTLYIMADRILSDFAAIDDVYYALPNIHIFPFDLSKFGLENLAEKAEVYMPIADPSGLITATISRPPKSKL